MFSKILFAGLMGKRPLLFLSSERNESFTFPSFTLESSSAGPTTVHNPQRDTCKPESSSTS